MSHYVGLDVSQEQTAVCILDEAGNIRFEAMVPTEPEELLVYLNSTGEEYGRIGLEAGTFSSWLYYALVEAGLPVVCIETRHAKSVMKAQPVKTDRNDARAIAQMMRTGWFRAIHIKSQESQRLRVLLNNRKCLTSKRIDIENQIRGTLNVFGSKTKSMTQARFDERIRELIAKERDLRDYISPLLESRLVLLQQGKALEKLIRRLAGKDKVCNRFMTIPGVGPIIALMYKTTIDNPHRFTKSQTIGAYLGLTPRKFASGKVDYDGRITKCGDVLLRTHLYEAAHIMLTRSAKWSRLKAWGIKIARRSTLKKASVAVARKLSIIMHRMWLDGTAFQFGAEA
jgi:transposase